MSVDRINYMGSAVAALDQALDADAFNLTPADWLARANVFAALAIADELRQAREQRPTWPAADVAAHTAQHREGPRP